jgi:hypothetical protein
MAAKKGRGQSMPNKNLYAKTKQNKPPSKKKVASKGAKQL